MTDKPKHLVSVATGVGAGNGSKAKTPAERQAELKSIADQIQKLMEDSDTVGAVFLVDKERSASHVKVDTTWSFVKTDKGKVGLFPGLADAKQLRHAAGGVDRLLQLVQQVCPSLSQIVSALVAASEAAAKRGPLIVTDRNKMN